MLKLQGAGPQEQGNGRAPPPRRGRPAGHATHPAGRAVYARAMNDADLPLLRDRLLDWYDRSRRELPWRASGGERPDPYQVWLSEVMLQQTRVETVRAYYLRWIELFPTVEALAQADQDEVMKAWEGLGYYSRARNLHRAVREVARSYGGRVPDDPDTFRSLPGVGRYTAGAVMSIAFGREEPVVDGNVRRVLARLLDDPEPADSRLWAVAERLVKGERPGDLNQAVMELGATVCTPRSPQCGRCPVADFCAARRAGTQAIRPQPRRRAPLPHEQRVAAVVEGEDGRVLLGRRPDAGRLGGMWEFPGGLLLAGEEPAEGLPRAMREATGLEIVAAAPVATVDHTFTHVRVSYHGIRGRVAGGAVSGDYYPELRWIPPAGLGDLPLPRAQQRLAALAVPARRQG